MITVSCYIDAGAGGKQNDDRAAVCGTVLKEGYYTCDRKDGVLTAVLDGVGGEAFGYYAATIAAHCVAGGDGMTQTEQTLREIVLECNRRILEKQKADGRFREMASTVSGLYLKDGKCFLFNVGDSKVFRYSGGFMKQLTADDSLGGHVLSKWLGKSGLDLTVDEKPFGDEDIFIVCSDGVSDTLSFDEWEAALKDYVDGKTNTEDLLRGLVRKAIVNGSEDNCTVILVDPRGDRQNGTP